MSIQSCQPRVHLKNHVVPPARLKTYFTLLRLPNLLTVPLDPVVGIISLSADFSVAAVAFPVMSVLLMYSAGLFLNDYCDREKDAAERPERPIPAGKIEPLHVLRTSLILLIAGIGSGWAAGSIAGCTAVILAFLVLAYSCLHARHRLAGVLLMAGCRAGAILLGAAATGAIQASAIVPASSHFVYILLLTLCAADEARQHSLPFFVAVSPLTALIAPMALLPGSSNFIQLAAVMLLFSWIVLDTLKSANACRERLRSVSEHIGTLVRNLIIIQGIWIVLYLENPDTGTVAVVAGGVFFMRYSSELLSEKFSSS